MDEYFTFLTNTLSHAFQPSPIDRDFTSGEAADNGGDFRRMLVAIFRSDAS